MYASKNVRLFKNPILERFSYVHPATPGLIFGPFTIYMLYLGLLNLPVVTVALAVIAGLFIWTLTEYTLHRFLFHFPATSAFGKRMVFIFHGIHHTDPEDARRLVMPPAAGIAFATLFYLLFQWILSTTAGPTFGNQLLAPFFAGFIAGYLCYDYIHFWVHYATPKSKVGRYLKQYHMLHHFVTPNQRYGVSNPLWDYIVGSTGAKSPAKAAK